MDKKKPATPKDDQPTQANYSSLKIISLQVAASFLVLTTSAVFIVLAGTLAKLLGGA